MKRRNFRNSLLAGVFLFFIFSILLNIFLYAQLRKYYTLLYAAQLDPLGLSHFQDVAELPLADPELQTVVFFGDSRAAQWPGPGIDGYRFLNRGIGNQTSAQVISRFEEHIEPLQPDLIVLQLGINDLKTIPLFPERNAGIISNCQANISEIIRKSLELNSTVVISTIFPTGEVPWQRRLVWSTDIDEAITEVNHYISTLAEENVIVFDAAKILSDANGKMRPEYGYDELHLNEAGYAALNLEFIKMLDSLKSE